MRFGGGILQNRRYEGYTPANALPHFYTKTHLHTPILMVNKL